MRGLSEEQRSLLEAIGSAEAKDEDPAARRLAFDDSLSMEQSFELAASWKFPISRRRPDTEFPSERAARWVFQRVVALGWTPKLFGEFDRRLQWQNHGASSRSERFGKKYQWIAFHELIARIADNYHPEPHSYADWTSWAGLYLINDREVDPSLPPPAWTDVPDGEDDAEPSDILDPHVNVSFYPPAGPPFERYSGNVERFLADEASFPSVDRYCNISVEGRPWVLLDGFFRHRDSQNRDPDKVRGLEEWVRISSWLVPSEEATRFAKDFVEIGANDRSDLVDVHGHVNCCYLGELGWRQMSCYHHVSALRDIERHGVGVVFSVIPMVEHYTWEGRGLDGSLQTSMNTVAPSAYIQERGGLRWNGRSACWLRADGSVVAARLGPQGYFLPSGFAVDKAWLTDLFSDGEMTLVVGLSGERQELTGFHSAGSPWLEFQGAAALQATGALVSAGLNVLHHP